VLKEIKGCRVRHQPFRSREVILVLVVINRLFEELLNRYEHRISAWRNSMNKAGEEIKYKTKEGKR